MADIPWWASDDPWSLSPDEVADLKAELEADKASIPENPPF